MEEVEDVNTKDDEGYEAENENEVEYNNENELSDDMFNLREEEIKSNNNIKVVYDANDYKYDTEHTSLDKSLKLYNNNINVMKPKALGNIKTLFFIKNFPILMLAESGN
jgi:hypothetical protein